MFYYDEFEPVEQQVINAFLFLAYMQYSLRIIYRTDIHSVDYV